MTGKLIRPSLLACTLFAIFSVGADVARGADAPLQVRMQSLPDSKAVFATVESLNQVPARARIGGTVTSLLIDEGSAVSNGQVVGTVVDEKLALQIKVVEAQIRALDSQLRLTTTELERAQKLFQSGTIPKARLDQAQTAVDAATGELRARRAERDVIGQQLAEGEIRAPTGGRVINVPVTIGTVVLPGETIAIVATENFVLRLRIPERHARFIKDGDPVSLAEGDIGQPDRAVRGKIIKVYPQIDNGRVIADAQVDGLGDFFVGERVRILISAGERTGFAIPADYVFTRAGVDYVRVKPADGEPVEVPVQRGQSIQVADGKAQVEVLSGLKDGDVLVKP